MKCILILFLTGFLGVLRGWSQVVEQPGENRNTYSEDTVLINRYIKKALPFSLNPQTRDSARIYLQKIYLLSQYRHYHKGMTEYYRIKAAGYYLQEQNDSLAMAMNKAFFYARRSGDARELALVNDLKAWVFHNREEYDSAVNYYITALHIADSLKDNKFSGEIDINLSVMFWSIKDFKNAIKYATKGYRAGEKLKDSLIIINCLFNLGNAKWGQKQYDTALLLFKQVSGLLHDPVKYNYTLVRALANEGGTLLDMGRNTEAVAKYKEALKFQPAIRPSLLPFLYNGLGAALLKENKLKEAEANIVKAIRIGEKTSERMGLRDSYQYMASIKETQKQFAAALRYRKKYDSLKDTLASESTKKNMHLLEIKYETAQKNKQIAEQQLSLAQKQRSIERKNTWIFVILGGLLALLAILVLSVRAYRHKKKLHQQSLLTLRKEHEVRMLKTKMEAREEERDRIGKEMHDDIGSALTTILYLSDDLKTRAGENTISKTEKIAHTAGSVVDKMNEIIWSMNREYDTLDDLMAYTRQHAAEFLENYGLTYHFSTPDPVPDIHLQGEQRRNIYLVIKESLHNIVKHAGAAEVQINFQLSNENQLKVVIKDNGKGMDPEKLRRFGNGLRNMKQRMESVGGTFDIRSGNGTTITLQCPIEKRQAVRL